MSWDWSSPIALGLFLIMAAVAVVFLGYAVAVATSGVRIGTRRNGR
jgi:hypothetical protein